MLLLLQVGVPAPAGSTVLGSITLRGDRESLTLSAEREAVNLSGEREAVNLNGDLN